MPVETHSDLDQIRSNPLILNTSGIHWSYILEELIPDLSLENIREGEDQKLKNEALLQTEKIYKELISENNKVNMGTFISRVKDMGMVGSYSSSCPTVFKVFSETAVLFGKEYFNCPRCQGKIESGKGISTCPHCEGRL